MSMRILSFTSKTVSMMPVLAPLTTSMTVSVPSWQSMVKYVQPRELTSIGDEKFETVVSVTAIAMFMKGLLLMHCRHDMSFGHDLQVVLVALFQHDLQRRSHSGQPIHQL